MSSIPRNELLKNRTNEDRKRYTKQQNLFVSLLRKKKYNYHSKLNKINVIDNKKYFESCQTNAFEQICQQQKINLSLKSEKPYD